MRFVRINSAEQQGQLMQHRARDLLMRQRTQLINALRAHLAELGIVAAKGDNGVKELLSIVADEKDARLPIDARAGAATGFNRGQAAAWADLQARRPLRDLIRINLGPAQNVMIA
jgi:transposase